MAEQLERLIEQWDGLGVVCRFDAPTRTRIFICLHDNTLGPSTGGTRMKTYPTAGAALEDAMRLATGMTHKWAAIGGPWGGGKAVLAVERPLTGEERRGLLLRYAGLIESLKGAFWTGEDMGTTTTDMEVIAEGTRYVHGFDPADGSKVDPSPFTARGVFSGIQAALGVRFGSAALDGRRVLVQGVGNVGRRLAEELAAAGARVLVADADAQRAAAVAADLGAEVVTPDQVYATPCDVYAPCAVGATLNSDTIPRLACSIVAGSANNQLAEADDAGRLEGRGILYAPDYVVNAGGALAFAQLILGISDRGEIFRRVEGIGATLRRVLEEAAEHGESPVEAAARRVETALAGRRRGSGAEAPGRDLGAPEVAT